MRPGRAEDVGVLRMRAAGGEGRMRDVDGGMILRRTSRRNAWAGPAFRVNHDGYGRR
jgi:hypothetical protein